MVERAKRFVRLTDCTNPAAVTMVLAIMAEAIKAGSPTFGMPFGIHSGPDEFSAEVLVYVDTSPLLELAEKLEKLGTERAGQLASELRKYMEQLDRACDVYFRYGEGLASIQTHVLAKDIPEETRLLAGVVLPLTNSPTEEHNMACSLIECLGEYAKVDLVREVFPEFNEDVLREANALTGEDFCIADVLRRHDITSAWDEVYEYGQKLSDIGKEHNAMYEAAFENLPEEHREILRPFRNHPAIWPVLVGIAESLRREMQINPACAPSSLKELADAVAASTHE